MRGPFVRVIKMVWKTLKNEGVETPEVRMAGVDYNLQHVQELLMIVLFLYVREWQELADLDRRSESYK